LTGSHDSHKVRGHYSDSYSIEEMNTRLNDIVSLTAVRYMAAANARARVAARAARTFMCGDSGC